MLVRVPGSLAPAPSARPHPPRAHLGRVPSVSGAMPAPVGAEAAADLCRRAPRYRGWPQWWCSVGQDHRKAAERRTPAQSAHAGSRCRSWTQLPGLGTRQANKNVLEQKGHAQPEQAQQAAQGGSGGEAAAAAGGQGAGGRYFQACWAYDAHPVCRIRSRPGSLESTKSHVTLGRRLGGGVPRAQAVGMESWVGCEDWQKARAAAIVRTAWHWQLMTSAYFCIQTKRRHGT